MQLLNRVVLGLIVVISLLVPAKILGQYMTTVCQNQTTALVGLDRNDFVRNNAGIPNSEGYIHNFLPPVLPCGVAGANITSLAVAIDLMSISTPTGLCTGIPIFGNVLFGCPLESSPGVTSICSVEEDALAPGCGNFMGRTTTGLSTFEMRTCGPVPTGTTIGVDIIPATDAGSVPGCPTTSNAITNGDVVLTYEICLTFTYDRAESNSPSIFSSLQTNYCQGDAVQLLPSMDNNGVMGTWLPSTIDNMNSDSYVFTPVAGSCTDPFTLNVNIVPTSASVFSSLQTNYCQGDVVQSLPNMDDNGVMGTWLPAVIDNMASGSYVFTPGASSCVDPFTLNVNITPNSPSVFGLQTNYCQGDVVQSLPSMDNNGVMGIWSPSVINNMSPGSYVFTPVAGSCTAPFTLNVNVSPAGPSVFSLQTNYCQGDVVQSLPSMDNNGVMGIWSPSVINNMSPGSYVFTPVAGSCTAPFTLNVNVSPVGPSVFMLSDTYCQGDAVETLQDVDENGVMGVWSPSVINNMSSGSYVFTPVAGSCATPFTLNVDILPSGPSVFILSDSYCQGDAVETLQDVDENGVMGVWSPSAIDNMNSGSYVFTPVMGSCAAPFTLNVDILPSGPSVFMLNDSYCQGDAVETLQDVDENGVMGVWSPSAIDNMNSGSYVFTPVMGSCATPFTLNVTVDPADPSEFTLRTSYCPGETVESLPTTDNNGVMGTWSPAVIDNLNSGSYVFTPVMGSCAAPFTLNVAVDASSPSEFTLRTSYCPGETVESLPTTDNNGVMGTWSPTVIDNMGSGSYVFTPAAGGCTTPFTLNVVVAPASPSAFSLRTEYCQNEVVETLPTTDNNGVMGTWMPAVIDNQNSGSYVFTPAVGSCALPFTLDVDVAPVVASAFNLRTDYCQNEAVETLPVTDDNGVMGTWVPAVIDNQNSGSYVFTPAAGSCALPFTLDVDVAPVVASAFNLRTDYCQNEAVETLPATDDNGVMGTWVPAVIDDQNSGSYVFTPVASSCALPFTLDVTITPTVILEFSLRGNYCPGETVEALPSMDDNGVPGSWMPAVIDNLNSGSYVFTPAVSTCTAPFTLNVVVAPASSSVFSLRTDYCENEVVETLPATDNNGVVGTWMPAVIDNLNSGSYVFTPSAGGCALPFTLDVTVTPVVASMFNLRTDYCENEVVETLPVTDDNGVMGTWLPAVIDNQNSGSYVFTPVAGSCVTPFTLDVTVTPVVASTFNLRTNYCENEVVETLPVTDDNGVMGTWVPAVIDNLNSGSYVFTPVASSCALPFTLDVIVTPVVASMFNLRTDYCQNETVEVLLDTDDNGIMGSWLPAVIDNQNSGSYVFTPVASSCALPFTLDVTVSPVVASVFALRTNYCQNEVVETLSITDDNGVMGAWMPATIDNQNSGTYTFTPTAGQCVDPFVLTVTVDPLETPTFTLSNAYCQGDNTDALPAISGNGITGTWLPAVIDNQNSGSYVFTPANNECALPFTLDVVIDQPVATVFNLATAYCQGDNTATLMSQDDNGITGTWLPAVIDNQNSGSYVFTPANNECALPFTLDVVIDQPVTTVFNLATAYCQGDNTATLMSQDDNGITGTWMPAVIDNQNSGVYTFTPAATECALPFVLNVTIDPNVASVFSLPTSYCRGETVEVLPNTDNNGVMGTWSPAVIDNQLAGSYTFTPAVGQCALPFTLNVNIEEPLAPVFAIATTYCQDDIVDVLPVVSNNGISGSWSPAAIDDQNSGTYIFTPIAGSCALPFTLDVVVNPLVTPSFNLVTAYCFGETTEVLPMTSDNGVMGTWSPATIDNQASGTYVFTPINSSTCSLPYTHDVNISPLPVLSLVVTNEINCFGDNDGALELTVSGATDFTVSWNDPAIGNNLVPTNLGPGEYIATVTTQAGCVNQVAVTIAEPAPLVLDCSQLTEPNRPLFLDGGVNLQLQGGTAPYTVTFTGPANGVQTTSASNLLLNNLPGGDYQVTLTDAQGCMAQCNFSLTLGCPLTAEVSGVSSDCSGLDGSIVIDTIIGGDGFYEYSLDGNTYAMVGAFPFAISVAANADYTLSLQDGDACFTTEEVFVPEPGELVLELGEDLTIKLGDSFELRPQFNFIPFGWTWSDSTYLSQPDSLFTFVRPLESTTVQLAVIDANGCLVIDEIAILVDRREDIYVPNAFSPNGDGVNDEFTIYVGDNIERITSFQVFNRWGDRVTPMGNNDLNNLSASWDGTFRGSAADLGVYLYVIEAMRIDGEQVLVTGEVTLIR